MSQTPDSVSCMHSIASLFHIALAEISILWGIMNSLNTLLE